VVLVVLTVCISALTVGAPGAGARGVTASVAVPVVTGVSPTVGALDGGNQVLIQGSGFLGATAVKFGSTTAGFFYVWGDGLILAFAPAHAFGQVDVTVTTPGGTSATGTGTRFTFSPPTNGELHGSVTTEDHQSATGMLVVAVDSVTQLIVAATTVLSDGTWQFTELAPGQYHAVVVGDARYQTKLAGWEHSAFVAQPAPENTFAVTGGATTVTGPMNLWLTTPKPSTAFDFTGDGKADAAWVDGTNGDWFLQNSSDVVANPTKFFTGLGIPVAGDYDGDGRWEPAYLSGGNWVTAATAGTISFPAPTTTNRPPSTAHDGPEAVPGAYDGNRTTVPAWYRQEDATWFIKGHDPIQFGSGPSAPAGASQVGRDDYDRPIPADFDGDGHTDLAVWNPRTHVWKYLRSSDGVVVTRTFGPNLALPAVADYTGDKKADLAAYGASGVIGDRPAWQIDGVSSMFDTAYTSDSYLGLASADYDGDGKADRAFWNSPPSTQSNLQWLRSSNFGQANLTMTTTSGNKTPIPIEGSYYRMVETAYLTSIWKCVSNAIYC